MSEPIRLFRGGQEIIITAPSQVQLLIREGWSVTAEDDVPFDIEEPEEPEPEEPVKSKRGRPKAKAQK
ncbi:MAG: hypothetical protein IPJ48_17860 [Propionivibrio sp.]|uniref:Uncharacterized protein n=1 Tax=Candidatus Propionivibrio dominans TaxID=2954373 RepID=A0A9D7FHB7_9RHOO|nr:hypothetical protein [Candidatus Propionivibrio dominans]